MNQNSISWATGICLAALCLLAGAGHVTAAMNGTWVNETVDVSGNDDVGANPSLAFDPQGNPSISYVNYTEGISLKFAWKSGNTWQNETVDSVSWEDLGRYNSLAFNSSGTPFISYVDETRRDLKFAWKSGGTWHNETVDSGLITGRNSLAINGTGVPCISYYDSNVGLKFAWKSGGTWQIETVENDDNAGDYNSLAFNASGNPCICYRDIESGLRYAWKSGGSWQSTTVDPGDAGKVGRGCSLAFDGSGNPSISYASMTGLAPALKYAWVSGGTWYTEFVVPAGDITPEYVPLGFDRQGTPSISYQNETSSLFCAWKSGGTWYTRIVDSDTYMGESNSLAFDRSGVPGIGYYDWGDGDLRYARFVPAPEISTVSPKTGERGTKVKVTVKGRFFQSGATVNLTRGAAVLRGPVKSIIPGKIVATVKIPAKAKTGKWNIVVTNPDGWNATRLKAFSVTV